MNAENPDRLRIFVDSDVLFAGSASASGASHLVLQLSELGIVEALISQQVRVEVERNLVAKLPAALPAMRALIDACCREPPNAPEEHSDRITRDGLADAKDAPILAAAIDAGCAWLLTFNTRDYRAADQIRVGTPGEFITSLRERLLSLAEK